LDVLSAIKNSIFVVKAAFLFGNMHAIIAMARLNNDPKYNSYRNGNGLKDLVEDFLNASGVYLSNGGGLEGLQQFQTVPFGLQNYCV